MILIGRHGATPKNINGGGDNFETPLAPEGERQARAMGAGLHAYLVRHDIRVLDIVTSGFERANATAREATGEIERLSADDRRRRVVIGSFAEDGRIGEIKFTKDVATPQKPGFFNRQLAGTTRVEVLSRLAAFQNERLLPEPETGRALLVIGHRGTTQVLAEQILEISEPLWKMHNCECLQILDRKPGIGIVLDGIKAERDLEDVRRIAFVERYGRLTDARVRTPPISALHRESRLPGSILPRPERLI